MAKPNPRGGSNRPDPLAAYLAQGLAAHQRGQLDEAERIYTFMLSKNPRHADALHFSGVLKLQQGQTERGIEIIQAAIRIRPSSTMRCNLANGLIQLARHAEALQQLDLSLAQDPTDPAAHTNRGVALAGLNRHPEAMQAYQRALRLRPDYLEALNNLGNTQRALGQFEESLTTYARALQLNPGYPEALNNRGLALNSLFRPDEAIASYNAALNVRANYPEALNNRGNALKEKGDFDAAQANYDQALALRPTYIEALYNRANNFGAQNRHRESLQGYEAVLALDPANPDAHWNRALTHLLLGEFEQGWAAYHWRWKMPAAAIPRQFACPQWTGDEDLQGRSILVWAEQGLGDMIQFCRLALRLIELGAKVWLDVQPALIGLMGSLSPEVTIISKDDPVPATDFHCPLLGLPGALHINLANIPAHTPYLAASPAKLAHWQSRITGQRPRIGLVCSGNPKLINDRRRSIPLKAFAPLLDTGASVWLLQKDVREADAAWLAAEPRITDLRAELADFDDTAAIIAQLDLVISVDTSVAHLAGALGRPVWVLLPAAPDWRWLLDRNDSPWYPGMRLYRQPRQDDWVSVLVRVVGDLRGLG